uniref:MIF4G domain-containing protein n=1 Tax=Panagrolaimus davidi TaxID=227884 RepID=A0A914P948_9BILA
MKLQGNNQIKLSYQNSIIPSAVFCIPRDIHEKLLNVYFEAEEANAKTPATVPKSFRDVLLEEYEKKIDEFISKPENLNFHLVSCPLSEDELKKIGIDRSTIYTPLSRGRGGNVNAYWGRNSIFIQKKPSSIPLIKAPINEYKDAQELTDLIHNFRNLIDKLSPSTFELIRKKITEIPYNQISQILPTIAEILFEKAVNDHLFAEVCANLCKIVYIIEMKNKGAEVKSVFCGAIIGKCQSSFEGPLLLNQQKLVDYIQKQFEEEKRNKTKLAVLNENEKQRIIGTIKFISHLYRVRLLGYKIIEYCVLTLIRNAENPDNEKELMVEYVIVLIETVGPTLFQRKEDKFILNGSLSYLFKDIDSTRIKSLIDDLIKYREQNRIEGSAVADSAALDTKLENNVPLVDKENEPTADVTTTTNASMAQLSIRENSVSENDMIKRPACEAYTIGCLYDAHHERFTGTSLFSSDVKGHEISLPSQTTKTIYRESINEKLDMLGFSAEFSVSVLCNIFEANGQSKYLSTSAFNGRKATSYVICKTTTKREILNLNDDAVKSQICPDGVKNSQATHVVTAITYGGYAVAVVSYEREENESEEDADKKLEAALKLFCFKASGGIGEHSNMTDFNENKGFKFDCHFDGNLPPGEKSPKTMEEAVDFMSKVPS